MTVREERQDAKIQEMEGAIFQLLYKLHADGWCGRDGTHLTECLDAVRVTGWTSWEDWLRIVEGS